VRVVIACAPGLERLLAAEVSALLARAPTELSLAADSVTLDVPDADALAALATLNVGLGLASSVRVELGSFSASQFPQLMRKLKRLPWGPWVPPELPVDVRVRSVRSRLYHTKALADRTRRAIGEALGGAAMEEHEVGSVAAHTRVHVEARANLFRVSVDTSGDPLYRRGYRLATGKAPLRADLARALVAASAWDATQPLGDPFCGAGTVLIEAALLGSGRPPGAGRVFALEAAPCYVAGTLEAARRRLEDDAARRPALPPLLGSDRDAGVVEAAQANAARAGVDGLISFDVAAVSDAPIFTRAALGPRAVVSNPPYGLRVGDPRTLLNLYQRLGALVRGLPAGSRVAFLTPPERPRDLGLALDRAFESNHGGQHVVASVATLDAG
jgi:putative N6-adenine-specific DNA methylase